MVELLVKAGASVDLKDEDGMTPLMTAVMCEHEAICRILVAHGADVHVEDADGETPLTAATSGIKAILLEKHTEAGTGTATAT